jgi:hypothetical protein
MKSHSFKGHTVLLGGIPIKPNFGDTPIKITHGAPRYGMSVGADGEASTEESSDRSATVEMSFTSTSDDNAKLMALCIADGPSGAGITTFDLVDTKGTSVYHSAEARLAGPPDIEIGTKVTARVWTVLIGNLDTFVGGN